MNQKTLKALNGSIAHWKRLATGKRNDGEDISPECCALCKAFMAPIPPLNRCGRCPVSISTGKTLCGGSPYVNASFAQRIFGLDSPEFKSAAGNELRFLKSLLPKKAGAK